MAKRVAGELALTGKPRGKTKYPWKELADGSTWLMKRGEDYTVPDMSIRQCAYTWGGRNRFLVHTKLHPDGVLVQFKRMKKLPPKRKKRPQLHL